MAWEKMEVHAGDGGHEEGRDESERERKIEEKIWMKWEKKSR